MFESYFEMLTPVTIGILAGIFALIGLFVWLKRSANKKSASPDIVTATTPAIGELKKVNGYECKCGQQFPEVNEIRKHVLTEGRKEKGKHGFAGRVTIEFLSKSQAVAIPTQLVKKPSILGTGKLRCLVVRGDTLEITTIPEPIGELYMAETSMPESGGMYTVRELEDGSVVDYDPRAVPVVIEETPEYAFLATHWEDAKAFWTALKPWWQSATNWWVAAILLIDFVAVLVFFGG